MGWTIALRLVVVPQAAAMTTKLKLSIAAVALVVVGAITYLSIGGIEANLVYYWSAEELLQKGQQAVGATVRLGGMVQEGSLDWQPDQTDLYFSVGMGPKAGGSSVRVHATEVPPQMFREGIGVVIEGKYDGQMFHADRLMVKHSNEYRAPKEGEKPQQIYKTLEQKSASQ